MKFKWASIYPSLGVLFFPQGTPGLDGVDGIDGRDGIPGSNGTQGDMVSEYRV